MMAHDIYTTPTANWSPLPDYLYLGPSSIHDTGLFTRIILPKGTNLGVTHVFTKNLLLRKMFPDGWVRSSIGAWYRHSKTSANCESVHVGSRRSPHEGDTKTLIVTQDIFPEEELLVPYTIYLPHGNY